VIVVAALDVEGVGVQTALSKVGLLEEDPYRKNLHAAVGT
jgi:hypothetical protein